MNADMFMMRPIKNQSTEYEYYTNIQDYGNILIITLDRVFSNIY